MENPVSLVGVKEKNLIGMHSCRPSWPQKQQTDMISLYLCVGRLFLVVTSLQIPGRDKMAACSLNHYKFGVKEMFHSQQFQHLIGLNWVLQIIVAIGHHMACVCIHIFIFLLRFQ